MNTNIVKKLSPSKLGVLASAVVLLGCCLVVPLLVGAACALALGLVGELAAGVVAVLALGLALGRRLLRDQTKGIGT